MTSARILIVEDEAIVAADLESRLKSFGYSSVTTCGNGDNALQLAETWRPDLVLMDIHLRDSLDGITVSRRIRERWHLPVVFVTAYSEEATVRDAMATEPYGFILKPFEDRELKFVLEIAYVKHRADKEIRRLNRLYEVLSRVNQTVVQTQSREELLPSVCRTLAERGGLDLVWIDWLDSGESSVCTAACSCGKEGAAAGRCVHDFGVEGASAWALDAINADRPVFWTPRETPQSSSDLLLEPSGLQTFASFPLRFRNRPCGALSVGVTDRGFFGDREVELFEEVTRALSFAFDRFEESRMRAEAVEALRESEARLNLIFNASSDAQALLRAEPDGRFTIEAANRALMNSIEADFPGFRGEPVGRDRSEFLASVGLSPAAIGRNEPVLRRVVETGVAAAYETTVAVEGGFREFDVSVEPVLEPDGSCRKVLWIGRDITERKDSERALRRSEEKFQKLFHLSPSALSLSRVDDGCYLDVNDEFLRMTEWGRDEVIGRRAFELGVWARPEQRAEMISLLSNRGSIGDIELELRSKSGRLFPALLSAGLVEIQSQRCFFASVRDITERKQAEDALRRSEAKWRSHIENAPVGIVVTDNSGRHIEANGAAEMMLGYEPGEMLGTLAMDLPVPEELEAARRHFAEAGEKGIATGEFRLRRKDGSAIPVSVRAARIDGERMLAVFQDMTEHHLAEQALREKTEELDRYFASSLDLLCIADSDARFRRLNPEWEKTLGYALDDLIGTSYLDLVHPDDLASTLGAVADLRAQKEVLNFLNRFRCQDGSYRWLEWRAYPQGDLVYAVARDVTDRKQAEQERERMQAQLLQAQKMESVGRLAGGVAHDFNNMLGVILGRTEMALEEVDPDSVLRPDLDEIQRAAQHSAHLTQQLLAFARKQTVLPKVLDLNEVVSGILMMLKRLIGEAVGLEWVPGPGLWPVRMDPGQVSQMLANLCVNAKDAIDGVGNIVIETGNVTLDAVQCSDRPGAVPGDYVSMSVSDTGSGMDRETMTNIFEPFFTTKSIGKGTGLGLATVYGIVRQNEGFVEVASKLGEGSVFTIYLPRHLSKAEQLLDRQSEKAVDRGNETILLVEDDASMLAVGTAMLRSLGYRVLTASAPGEAIRLAHENVGAIHLLITDVIMPEMNGRDLAKRLLSFYPSLRRLFMSGYTADVIAHHGVLDEGVNFIQKPFTRSDLAAKVREALDRD